MSHYTGAFFFFAYAGKGGGTKGRLGGMQEAEFGFMCNGNCNEGVPAVEKQSVWTGSHQCTTNLSLVLPVSQLKFIHSLLFRPLPALNLSPTHAVMYVCTYCSTMTYSAYLPAMLQLNVPLKQWEKLHLRKLLTQAGVLTAWCVNDRQLKKCRVLLVGNLK
jgi:hypothetical protein